eukprot:TRINITY_DN307_c0_g3_i1.p3 TRINITY_DN307_c0_g3~~TRINITY_DN307_c0_g3_i1.p3  ORF type:complete len:134 (-),score=25.17 TRINITY_DN307_c0_g3_i1:1241-1642(-)
MIKSYLATNNTVITSLVEIEKVITQQFTQLYALYNGSAIKISNLIKPISTQAKNIIGKPLSHFEVCEAILQMKPTTVPGPDLLQACIYQVDPPIFASPPLILLGDPEVPHSNRRIYLLNYNTCLQESQIYLLF